MVMRTLKVGQTVSVPKLPNMGKGVIYYVSSQERIYIKFAESHGKRVLPADLLCLESEPVKTSKRYSNDGEGGEEFYIPDSPSLQDSFGEMPSYNS